jgi:imidazoleglycerol-phosphate dehydratase
MDEALAQVVVDLSNRPFLVYHVPELTERIGDFETQLIHEFFGAFSIKGGVTLHINVSYGGNSHHMVEAIFKAWARAMRQACEIVSYTEGVPSTKGVL